MTYLRKYDFQPGTRISSSQVDEEFNQLIKAANDLEASNKLKAPIDKAQMYKITPDNGSVSFSLGGPGNNLWTVDGNLATFYSNKGTINNPDTEHSFRGLYITTGNDYGEMIALGNDRTIWRNSKIAGVWLGWHKSFDFRDFEQTQLWKGAYYMNTQTITPKKKLSECRTGWLLVWSDFNDATDVENDYNWAFSYIPKFFPSIDKGGGVYVPIINNMTSSSIGLTAKTLYVNDTTLSGNDDNASNNNATRDVVLRFIYEY
ncbi:hypothetical protein [Peribacillus frigoritolerans]|uniref:hypothetical protein n=1 Tax=Peribacillus frigoritolerans TaxID=450367 RepID=UPI00362EC63B